MKKQHTSLLLILITTAFVLVAGCTSPTQNNVAPANLTENASPSTSTTASANTTTSSAISPTPALRPSASPSITATPSSSPTPSAVSPSGSGKVATTIEGNSFFDADNTITRGSPQTTWTFSVIAQGKQPPTVCGVPLTATIDGRSVGKLTSQNGPDCFATSNYELSAQETAGLSVGNHTLTINFAGDNTYQPAKQNFPIVVT